MSTYNNDGQYARHSILRYERIFGEGYVSSGGAETTHWLADQLELPESPSILDIGSGLGGFAFYAAERFGATVVGVDYAPLMVDLSKERLEGHPGVTFEVADIRTKQLEHESFDLIWSRDSFLHIPEKVEVFERMAPWLKANGTVMITDYARSDGAVSAEFQAYADKGGYDLLGVDAYGELFRKAGYSTVRSIDWTDRFAAGMRAEKERLLANRASFADAFSAEDLDYLIARWDDKLRWCEQGDMHAGLWLAQR